jgi:hypothetical protein
MRLCSCETLVFIRLITQDIQAERGIIQASFEAPRTTYKLKTQYHNSEDHDMNLKISNYVWNNNLFPEHLELLCLYTFLIRYSRKQKTRCSRNWICLSSGEGGRHLLIWKELTSITGQPLSEPEAYVTTNSQLASLYWNKAPIWVLWSYFYYCQTVVGLLIWGALYEERMGSVIYNCCWTSPAQSFSGSHFTVSE